MLVNVVQRYDEDSWSFWFASSIISIVLNNPVASETLLSIPLDVPQPGRSPKRLFDLYGDMIHAISDTRQDSPSLLRCRLSVMRVMSSWIVTYVVGSYVVIFRSKIATQNALKSDGLVMFLMSLATTSTSPHSSGLACLLLCLCAYQADDTTAFTQTSLMDLLTNRLGLTTVIQKLSAIIASPQFVAADSQPPVAPNDDLEVNEHLPHDTQQYPDVSYDGHFTSFFKHFHGVSLSFLTSFGKTPAPDLSATIDSMSKLLEIEQKKSALLMKWKQLREAKESEVMVENAKLRSQMDALNAQISSNKDSVASLVVENEKLKQTVQELSRQAESHSQSAAKSEYMLVRQYESEVEKLKKELKVLFTCIV